MLRKAFFGLSTLPLFLLIAMLSYLRSFDGMTGGFAGLILILPLVLSIILSLVGLSLLWVNDPRIPRDRALWVSFGVSSSPTVYFVLKALL